MLMERLTAIWLRIKALVARRKLDRDLEEELAFHLAMRTEKMGAVDEAAVRRRFGNVARMKEACREMWTFTTLESFWQDLRYGLRGLRKTPALTAVAIITLALGIGASSWPFSMLKQWVIDAVDFPEPQRLMVLWQLNTKKGWVGTVSTPDFLDWQKQDKIFEHLSGWTSGEFNITGGDQPERILGGKVTPEFFRTLAVQPIKGRDFMEGEGHPGASHVAMVSAGLWRDRFGGNADLSSATLNLGGEPYTVVGVVPENFHFALMGRANIWVPLVFTDKQRADRVTGWLSVIGRVKPGISESAAAQAMSAVAHDLERAYPESNTNSGILLNSLSKEIGKHTGDQAVFAGFIAALCLLLIACSNVAGIYLARALARRKEISIRLALGAKRTRVARQLISENALLLPAAVGLGLALAYAGANWVTNAIPYENRGYLPNYGRIYIDSSTLIFAAGVSLLSVLLFSLAPITEGARLDLNGVLKDSGSSVSAGPKSHVLRKGLVVSQVILAFVVLIPAALTTRSFTNLLHVNPGFRPDHMLTAQLALPATKYTDKDQWRAFYDQLVEHVSALPQVEAAGASQIMPFGHHSNSTEFRIEGRPAPAPGEVPGTFITAVTSGYMSALGMSLERGRFINDADTAENTPSIVINNTLARRFFNNQDPLGRRIRLGRDDQTWYTIVGVVKDIKQFNLSERPTSQSYISFAQSPSRVMALVIRTKVEPPLLAASVRNAVWAIDKDQPVSVNETMEKLMHDEAAPMEIFAQFCRYFAMLALFLAGIGIYGVMAYLVEGRRREIGIRMACGARRRQILWLMLAGSSRLIVAGLSLGLLAGFAVGKLIANFLYGVTPGDPSVYAASAIVLCAAIFCAGFVPARRAIHVDPMIVLRNE